MYNNIPKSITDKIGHNLYKKDNHPIKIIKEIIYSYFNNFPKLEIDNPYVSVEHNFDRLLVPNDHPSRSCNQSLM